MHCKCECADYYYNESSVKFFQKTGKRLDIRGIAAGKTYLKESGIKEIDEWGETIIFQIIENEIFGLKAEDYETSLAKLSFAKFEMD